MEQTFRLVTIEKSQPPEGATCGRWHRYVIESDFTVIQGYAQGTKTEVTAHAKRYVTQLNARRDPNRSPGAWTRSRAKTQR